MVIHFVRAIYLLVVLAYTLSYAFRYKVYLVGGEGSPTVVTLYILIPTLAALCLVLVDMFWRRKRLQVLSGLFFGLLAGLVIAYVLAQIVDLTGSVFAGPTTPVENPKISTTPKPLPAAPPTEGARPPADVLSSDETDIIVSVKTPIKELVKVLLGVSAVFMCVTFVLQTKDDFRFVIPYVEFAKHTKGPCPLLLDTSVIIDGRIADIAETRILESEMIVPRFILDELQAIADSEDKLKRNRGRRGLDILNRLRSSDKIDIRIMDAHLPGVDETEEVDAKLVALTKQLDGRVVTNDYNLNKVAQLRDVVAVNINDLANALKPVFLPGETFTVKIIRPGEEPDQGVGYLEDGTMVVASGGKDHIGKEANITVTSVLQTSAGKMVFGRMASAKPTTRNTKST